ncbi:hypothetical protein SISSUDRAFT_1067129 [Sistotremastrum suecicum HHB10207 ss-3]|uniref:DUF6535 domain-containing protein n=1 Tax=Sistotremastrum suecicum HHB10207 ss-3 TaxID=1314776 RepID=A0A165XGX9_9AGAM|nr:hypothetical protein SISSUDRAFT_1067129 [Sistotremastrum suecicum HHB10207 ss-3]
MAEASDPGLLERAATSFSFSYWVRYGGGTLDDLLSVRTRLNATDTSFRVRETLNVQISRFGLWIKERRKQMEKNRKTRALDEELARGAHELHIARSKEREEQRKKEEEEARRAIELTKFLLSRREDNISEHFTPKWENCADIVRLISLPFDQFIAECLCINDHNNNLGDHQNIFFYAVNHCINFLNTNKFDDVTRMLSHVDMFSAVRSFALADRYFYWHDRVLKLIIGDHRTDILCFLPQFLRAAPDWSHVHPGGATTVFLIAAGSPPQFPSNLDFSPIIAHIGRHPSWETWRQASETLIAYLGQCDISTLSDPAGIRHFLQQCAHLALSSPPYIRSNEIRRARRETRRAALALLRQYDTFFTSNIPLPPSPPLPSSEFFIPPDFLPSFSAYLGERIRSAIAQSDPTTPVITPLDLDSHVHTNTHPPEHPTPILPLTQRAPEPSLGPEPLTQPDTEANPSTIALLKDQFNALLGAVNTLNATLGGVKTTLVDHGTKFDILIRDALKNDQPYEEKDLNDESTCLALYDMVVAKTKEKAEEWNGTIDVTLIFIALFSAVLTAFLVPATQALLPSSDSSSSSSSSQDPPPLPPRSDEIVCALYYLSLITAIVVAVLCALGRQWVRKLSTRPDVTTWKNRTIWHVERMRRAEKWIKALMEVIY